MQKIEKGFLSVRDDGKAGWWSISIYAIVAVFFAVLGVILLAAVLLQRRNMPRAAKAAGKAFNKQSVFTPND